MKLVEMWCDNPNNYRYIITNNIVIKREKDKNDLELYVFDDFGNFLIDVSELNSFITQDCLYFVVDDDTSIEDCVEIYKKKYIEYLKELIEKTKKINSNEFSLFEEKEW